jgi:hypothetical protein
MLGAEFFPAISGCTSIQILYALGHMVSGIVARVRARVRVYVCGGGGHYVRTHTRLLRFL